MHRGFYLGPRLVIMAPNRPLNGPERMVFWMLRVWAAALLMFLAAVAGLVVWIVFISPHV